MPSAVPEQDHFLTQLANYHARVILHAASSWVNFAPPRRCAAYITDIIRLRVSASSLWNCQFALYSRDCGGEECNSDFYFARRNIEEQVRCKKREKETVRNIARYIKRKSWNKASNFNLFRIFSNDLCLRAPSQLRRLDYVTSVSSSKLGNLFQRNAARLQNLVIKTRDLFCLVGVKRKIRASHRDAIRRN